ncbi:MAG: CPBP family glutamic-type intramembrane protease [Eubacteriaceae bacterium]|nr:CPBP family glutamic-type intramembrane protease [Eubacteriaceae bacterium]
MERKLVKPARLAYAIYFIAVIASLIETFLLLLPGKASSFLCPGALIGSIAVILASQAPGYASSFSGSRAACIKWFAISSACLIIGYCLELLLNKATGYYPSLSLRLNIQNTLKIVPTLSVGFYLVSIIGDIACCIWEEGIFRGASLRLFKASSGSFWLGAFHSSALYAVWKAIIAALTYTHQTTSSTNALQAFVKAFVVAFAAGAVLCIVSELDGTQSSMAAHLCYCISARFIHVHTYTGVNELPVLRYGLALIVFAIYSVSVLIPVQEGP